MIGIVNVSISQLPISESQVPPPPSLAPTRMSDPIAAETVKKAACLYQNLTLRYYRAIG